jgi:hypothetical protein
MLTDPKAFAAKLLELAFGDYHMALRCMMDAHLAYKEVPTRFWADVVIELNELGDWVKRT